MHYEICFSNHRAIHLKHLIMTDFVGDLNELINFVKHTPNLKNLTISAHKYSNMIVASRWQQLITSSLPYLVIFKFKFAADCQNEDNDILDKFQRFYKIYHLLKKMNI